MTITEMFRRARCRVYWEDGEFYWPLWWFPFEENQSQLKLPLS